jgi:hypothetical protein
LSTFIGDSTYTRAPPNYRSPLRSNNIWNAGNWFWNWGKQDLSWWSYDLWACIGFCFMVYHFLFSMCIHTQAWFLEKSKWAFLTFVKFCLWFLKGGAPTWKVINRTCPANLPISQPTTVDQSSEFSEYYCCIVYLSHISWFTMLGCIKQRG